MSYIIAGGAVGGAALGALQGRHNEKQQKKHDNYRRAAIMYSPWTGMQDPGAVDAGPGMFGSALQGAMKGGLLGAQVSSMGGAGAAGGAGGIGMGAPMATTAGGAADAMDMGGQGMPMMGGQQMSPFKKAQMMQAGQGMMGMSGGSPFMMA